MSIPRMPSRIPPRLLRVALLIACAGAAIFVALLACKIAGGI